MTVLSPKIPFIWPAPQVFGEPCIYEYYPPFAGLVVGSSWLFGIVPALTTRGVRVLDEWLQGNCALKVSIIVAVYPACSSRQADLDDLRGLAVRNSNRFSSRILPLEQVTDRSINALCFSAKDSDLIHMVIGPSEDLGLEPSAGGHLNFAIEANPSLLEAFRCHFDLLWNKSRDVVKPGATWIPELVLPIGSEKAALAWEAYLSELRDAETNCGGQASDVRADPESGEANTDPPETKGENPESPTTRLGIKKLDPLAELVAGLYAKGSLVTLNKRSKIPPLDAPLDPYLFGDKSELRRGSVTRKVSMRISVIDEATLRDIDSWKKAVWTLLTKFSFGIADSMRWMPTAARELFEAELERIDARGKRLIYDLLKGDVDGFLADRQDKLVADLNKLHTDLGLPGRVTSDVIDVVIQSLKERLSKAQSTSFIPELSYSEIGFRSTENNFANPWGQAFTLLTDIAIYPRRALRDRNFSHGLKSSRQEILMAMNVADDALLHDAANSDIEDRCDREFDLLFRIQDAQIASHLQCGLMWKLIQGNAISSIDAEMNELKKESREKETD